MTDAKSRKQKGLKPGRGDSTLYDTRGSNKFVPLSISFQSWCSEDSVGHACNFCEEIAITLGRHISPLHNPSLAIFQGLPRVKHETDGADEHCNRFAGIISADGTTNMYVSCKY